MEMTNLFGDDFAINLVPKNSVKYLVDKVTSIGTDVTAADQAAVTKALASSRLSLRDQLTIITDRVLKTLGRQRQNVAVIRSLDEYNTYIDKAIEAGIIAIDTETNNSLDPVTCMLMGLCLYVPGEKQVYIPVNHVDPDTKVLLDNQLTTEELHIGLQRLLDAQVFIVMHNGKFDYEVLKVTCGIEVVPTWDTIVAARLLNENEEANLKIQYHKKIDPSQEKYDIEKLFDKIPYAYVDPDIFALYAATDSLMTYRLFEWQYPVMTSDENKKLCWLFKNIEMPIVVVTAEMELRGVKVDEAFGEKLRLKYNDLLAEVDTKIEQELENLRPTIEAWRLDPKNNERTKVYPPKKTKKSLAKIEEEFNLVDKKGKRYKLGKAKVEQLGDPINLASPVQLAILFYDILGEASVSRKAPRGTGEEELTAIAKRHEENGDSLPICDLILERRGIVKLITGYIDTIPSLATHWPDHRIRFHLNSLGTDTGRYSSGGKIKFMNGDTQVCLSGINIQNIPSHNPEIRLLFMAQTDYHDRELSEEGVLELPEVDEIETAAGWKFASDLNIGDVVLTEEEQATVSNIIKNGTTYLVYFN